MITAGLCHAGHDLLRLRARPSLPDDWISVTTLYARPVRSLRRHVFLAFAIVFAVVLLLPFLPPRDASLAGDGGFIVAAVGMAVEWVRYGVPAQGTEASK
jgi:hypothetical protein